MTIRSHIAHHLKVTLFTFQTTPSEAGYRQRGGRETSQRSDWPIGCEGEPGYGRPLREKQHSLMGNTRRQRIKMPRTQVLCRGRGFKWTIQVLFSPVRRTDCLCPKCLLDAQHWLHSGMNVGLHSIVSFQYLYSIIILGLLIISYPYCNRVQLFLLINSGPSGSVVILVVLFDSNFFGKRSENALTPLLTKSLK